MSDTEFQRINTAIIESKHPVMAELIDHMHKLADEGGLKAFSQASAIDFLGIVCEESVLGGRFLSATGVKFGAYKRQLLNAGDVDPLKKERALVERFDAYIQKEGFGDNTRYGDEALRAALRLKKNGDLTTAIREVTGFDTIKLYVQSKKLERAFQMIDEGMSQDAMKIPLGHETKAGLNSFFEAASGMSFQNARAWYLNSRAVSEINVPELLAA